MTTKDILLDRFDIPVFCKTWFMAIVAFVGTLLMSVFGIIPVIIIAIIRAIIIYKKGYSKEIGYYKLKRIERLIGLIPVITFYVGYIFNSAFFDGGIAFLTPVTAIEETVVSEEANTEPPVAEPVATTEDYFETNEDSGDWTISLSLNDWVDKLYDDEEYQKSLEEINVTHDMYLKAARSVFVKFAYDNKMDLSNITVRYDQVDYLSEQIGNALEEEVLLASYNNAKAEINTSKEESVYVNPNPVDNSDGSWKYVDDDLYPDWSSDMYETEIGDYVPPKYYASDAERYVYTDGYITVWSPNSSYANIRSNHSTDSQVKCTFDNGRTLDYLGDAIQDGDRIWYHVGYYLWDGETPIYQDGWISSNVCDPVGI